MLGVRLNGYYANHIQSAVDVLGFTLNGNLTDLIYQTLLFSKEIQIPVFTALRHVTVTTTLTFCLHLLYFVLIRTAVIFNYFFAQFGILFLSTV